MEHDVTWQWQQGSEVHKQFVRKNFHRNRTQSTHIHITSEEWSGKQQQDIVDNNATSGNTGRN